MKNKIHFNQEEKLADNTERTVSAINETSKKIEENTKAIKDKTVETLGFTGMVKALKTNTNAVDDLHESINAPTKVIQKLDEVKSAALITNKTLKEIKDKKQPEAPKYPEFPKEMEMSIKGISTITLKGEDGKEGKKGDTGPEGPQGPAGPEGKEGKQGPEGKQGKRGEKGNDGKDGKDGNSGSDGSPDTPEEVVDKVNSASKKVNAKQVEGLAKLIETVDRIGTNPVGNVAGGGPVLAFRSNGTKISDHVTELDFTTNLTGTYSGDGRVTIAASGGGSLLSVVDITGARDDSNATFTIPGAPTNGVLMIVNNQTILFETVHFTLSGTTLTYLTAPGADLDGTPHKAILY
jgi:hypothetical protein